MDETLIKEICLYIDNHINEPISTSDIALEFHFDKFYLMRKFKEITGLTINQYINKQRIHNSMYDLIYTDSSILKVALNNGFNSLEYFSEQFNKIVGLSPAKFRNFSFSYGYFPFEGDDDMDKLEQIQSDLAELQKLQELISVLRNNNIDNKPNKKSEDVVRTSAKILVRKPDKKAA